MTRTEMIDDLVINYSEVLGITEEQIDEYVTMVLDLIEEGNNMMACRQRLFAKYKLTGGIL